MLVRALAEQQTRIIFVSYEDRRGTNLSSG